ncbi:MAG: OFA family MFS transporter [Candidatus Thermoplasmatota archaeon]|nr:OFA family MFS transporter [Candidatus Thermoplasmatota archaeon]
MEQKVMNRWIIVVGAILIQLSLGAIYAWSVFTTPLVAPLPDETFQNVIGDDIEVQISEGIVLGKSSQIVMQFNSEGEPITDFNSVSVAMELRNEDNEAVKADKIVPYLGIVYEKGDPITAGPFEADKNGNEYVFTIAANEDTGIKGVSKAGNWHYIVTATRGTGDNETTYTYDVLEQVKTGKFGFTITQTQLIFATGLFFFALFTIFGGRLSKRYGPRNIAIIGGAVLGAGYILASFMGTSFLGLIFAIGMLGGIGIGLGYVVPIAVGVKWFPDKKGLISGLAVAGFGFGALLWIKLCTGFVFGPLDLTPGWTGFFGDGMSVSRVFLIYGIAFAATVITGGLLMKNPPEGWKPKGWEPPEPKQENEQKATGSVEFTSKEMIKTPQYWMLFFMFMIGAGAGLMVIGVIQLFGNSALVENGYERAEAVTIAATAMALFYSLANGFGRIAWGAISDKIGRRWAFISMFAIQGAMMIAFYFIGGNEYLLYLGAAVIGFNFGGNFALFPSATADFFGNKSVGLNYGFVFFSYGIGGLIGPMLGGIMGDMNLWIWAFIPAGVALLISAVVAFLLKAPRKKSEEKD